MGLKRQAQYEKKETCIPWGGKHLVLDSPLRRIYWLFRSEILEIGAVLVQITYEVLRTPYR